MQSIDIIHTQATVSLNKNANAGGNPCTAAGCAPSPSPSPNVTPNIIMFLSLKPAFAIIFIPFISIIANTVITAPPSTLEGIMLNNIPILGKNAAPASTNAPIAIHHLFTTFVMATIPAFCPKAVLGNALNNTAVVEPSASASIAPDVSSPVASLLNPAIVIPLELPIVSSPDTIYIVAKLITASNGNFKSQGASIGIGAAKSGASKTG